MQYNKPFDQTDPNAPYQNGNPATGTDGSIPPAESIEFPQREIVNVIQWAFSHNYKDSQGNACAAPTNADLEQLRKAIQGMIKGEFPTSPVDQTPITVLHANAFSYINPATGSDTAYDGSQATVSGTKGPFATIVRGLQEMQKYNLNGFIYQINLADGTYSQQVIGLPPQNGSGTVALVGNNANPSACVITSTLGSCMTLTGAGANYAIGGVRLVAQGSPKAGDQNCCIWVNGQSSMVVASNVNVEFAATANNAPHIVVQNGGSMFSVGNHRITGNAYAHIVATDGIFTTGEPGVCNFNFISAVTFAGAFMTCDTLGQIYLHSSVTNNGNCTAKRYDVQTNAIIKWNLAGGANPPGTIAGTSSTGGQYIAF